MFDFYGVIFNCKKKKKKKKQSYVNSIYLILRSTPLQKYSVFIKGFFYKCFTIWKVIKHLVLYIA